MFRILEYNTFTPVDPGIVFLVWRMNQRISRFVLFDEVFDGLDGPRRLPSLHICLVSEILYLESQSL